MPYVVHEIDIDIDEFLSACSKDDIQQLIQALEDDGHLSDGFGKVKSPSPAESEFEDALFKLHGKWNSLSAEEEQMIINISKKF